MLDRTTTKFSHVKSGDTEFVSGGLRDFFLYRDLGVAEATHGKVIAHLVKANMAPETGTGWHRHEADFQIVIMTKGWARFMYEDKETLVELMFKVEVKGVSVVNTKGKTKRFGKSVGRRDNVRKAYVTLKPGQELNLGGEAA